MANYNETPVSGQEWQRARLVQVNNEYEGNKSVTFVEEKILNLSDGRLIHSEAGQITEPFSEANANTAFPLVDPSTNQPIGQNMTYGAVYVALYSLYFYLAQIRDEAQP